MGLSGAAYGNLEGKAKGRMTLVGPKYRCENNIETEPIDIRYGRAMV